MVPSFLMTPVAVDKTNIDRVLVQSGYLPREAVYGKSAPTP
jgi:D-xylose transport system substrate-binding protein